jgi:hypothetical protein
VSSGAFSLDEKNPTAHFDDFVAPTVTSLTASQSAFTERSFFFFFSSSEGGTFECRIGTAAFAPCNSGFQKTFDTEGPFTFSVRAFDASGNPSGIQSTQVTAVDTAITSSGPPARTNSTSASFNFSTGAGIGFECSLDGAAFSSCGSGATGSKSYTGLAEGLHTFKVRAVNGQFVDQVPATRTWTVDTTPPDTTILTSTGPLEGAVTTLTSALFTFSSTEPTGATFQCKLDTAAAFTSCTNPANLTNIAAGQRNFQVRATDAAGNTDPTPAKRSWSVQPPDADADGYNAAVDCNDSNPNINPGKAEILNNDVDENCDGKKDFDRDHDGSLAGKDCDDNNAARTPGKVDIPDNGVDEDCNGVDAVNPDRDGDGVPRPADCDDANPAVHPGAVDVPGNAVDEDCTGGPEPAKLTPMSFTLGFSFAAAPTWTKLKPFTINSAPIGSKVTVSCKGKKCPKPRSFTVSKAKQKVPGYAGKKLRVGWVLTFTVKKTGFVTGVKTLTIKKKKAPVGSVVKCLYPGAKKPTTCAA